MTGTTFEATKTYILNKNWIFKPNWPSKYLSVRCIWMYLLLMSRTRFRVNPHSVVPGMSKKILARNNRDLWRLSDCSDIQSHNHLVCKKTLNHLTKLAKWLSCVLSTYLYGAFDCMFLSCHVCITEWIHTLQLPQCQGTLCSM